PILKRLARDFGARRPRALHCSVDAALYTPRPVPKRWDLGYVGTYSADRQPMLERLLIEPARRLPDRRFVVAGPQYPRDIVWPANVSLVEHVPPSRHAAFYASCRFTLNVTRADMIRAGYSPSVRLFEAAACGTPIISDVWEGLERFFAPGREIVLARTAQDVLAALTIMDSGEAQALSRAARRRVLAQHAAEKRACELEGHLVQAIATAAEAPAASEQNSLNQQAFQAFG
ncbi:MAG: glycosyltransferase, partial [Methylobacteriaceae bacterium]|nr:glycosyltransferase [Methylobacteriaceae bacterium]